MRFNNLPGNNTRRRCLAVIWFVLLVLMPVRAKSGIAVQVPEGYSDVHLIAVGINTYKAAPLKFARADATAFADAVEAVAPVTGGRIHKHILLDDDATRASIESAFNKVIEEAGPRDLFIFYFAGRALSGTSDKVIDDWYKLPLEYRDKVIRDLYLIAADYDRVSSLQLKAVSTSLLKAWTSRLQTGRQFLVFDAGYTEEIVANYALRVKSEGAKALLLSDRRIRILGPASHSYVDSQLGHGYFTFDLIQGLSGKADTLPKDGRITAEEMDIYTRGQALLRSVKTETPNDRGRIASSSVGPDFDIARVKDFRGVREAQKEEPTSEKKESLGKDYALLIATDDYDSWAHLPNPVNDAKAIAEDLRTIYNFEVRTIENPTLDEIYGALGEYADKQFFPGDQLFIFIAGHGYYIENTREGFLIARNSKSTPDDPYGTTYIPHARLRDIVDHIPVKHIFLVMDACFGGTFDQRIADAGVRGGDEYAEVSAKEFKERKMKHTTRRYLTSGGKEYVPDGRPGHHSPFARKLLEALRSYGGKDGYLTIGEIIQYVEKVDPEPRTGEFGTHDPGGDLVLLHESGKEP